MTYPDNVDIELLWQLKKDRKTQWSIDTCRWSVVCTMWLQVRVVLKWRGWYWCRSIIQEDWLIALPLYMVTLASFYIKAISNEVHSTNKRAFKVKHCIELFSDQVHTSSTILSSNTLIVMFTQPYLSPTFWKPHCFCDLGTTLWKVNRKMLDNKVNPGIKTNATMELSEDYSEWGFWNFPFSWLLFLYSNPRRIKKVF